MAGLVWLKEGVVPKEEYRCLFWILTSNVSRHNEKQPNTVIFGRQKEPFNLKKSVKLSQTLEDSGRWRSLLGFMWVDRKGCCSEDGTARWLKWELCQTDEMLTATVSSIQSDFRCFREMF